MNIFSLNKKKIPNYFKTLILNKNNYEESFFICTYCDSDVCMLGQHDVERTG